MKDPQLPGTKILNIWAKRHGGKNGPPVQPTLTEQRTSKVPALTPEQKAKQMAFERVVYDMSHNERVINDVMLGRRVAFYELRGEIGTGNFSQVKLGSINPRFDQRARCCEDSKQDASRQEVSDFICYRDHLYGKTLPSEYSVSL